jgi:hypothetical protein
MKKTAIAIALALAFLFSMLAGTLSVNLSKANPSQPAEIPPIVSVPEIQINAEIARTNGTLWAKVDATYSMNTIHSFGDTFQAPNYGFGLYVDPSPYVTFTVAYDRLDAQYPVPLGATNISIKINDSELDWAPTNRTFHLFNANLPELHWKITPVPSNFLIAAHCEQSAPTTVSAYSYLGKNAYLFPLGARYGLQEVISYAYNEYPWFGDSSVAKIGIQLEPTFNNIHAYSIDGFGKLKPLNYTISTGNSAEKIELTVSGETPASYETTSPYGIVLVFDDSSHTSEPFPTVTVAAVSAAVVGVVVAAGLLVYFKKHQR